MCPKQVFTSLAIVLLFVCESSCRKRKPRFLSFNSLNGDVSVDLEFSIPFISIPVKKTMDTFGPTGLSFPQINVNVPALALGGAVVVGTAIVIPFLMKTAAAYYPDQHYARFIENTHFGSDSVLNMANQLMTDTRGFHQCVMKVACWTGRRMGHEETNGMIQMISRNAILSTMFNSTAFEEALTIGRTRRDCSAYDLCPLRDEHIPFVMHRLVSFGKPAS